MPHSSSPHHDDDVVVLNFLEKSHNRELPLDIGDDPLENLINEFDNYLDDEAKVKEQMRGRSSIRELEERHQNISDQNLEKKAILLQEIIQRTKYYMSDIELYLHKGD